jgi:hypothetical protein
LEQAVSANRAQTMHSAMARWGSLWVDTGGRSFLMRGPVQA